MTLADLIRELQELDIDPATPVHFVSNGYDADEPLITLEDYHRDGAIVKDLTFYVHSDDLETELDELNP